MLCEKLKSSTKAKKRFVEWDEELLRYFKDGEEVERPFLRNEDIIEELGVVNHVVTDKTGTLTQNVMRFYGLADTKGYRYAEDVKIGVPVEESETEM